VILFKLENGKKPLGGVVKSRRALAGEDRAVAKVDRVLGRLIPARNLTGKRLRPVQIVIRQDGFHVHTAVLLPRGRWTLVCNNEGFEGVVGGKYNCHAPLYVEAARELGLLTAREASHWLGYFLALRRKDEEADQRRRFEELNRKFGNKCANCEQKGKKWESA